jgi:hypothetical protein
VICKKEGGGITINQVRGCHPGCQERRCGGRGEHHLNPSENQSDGRVGCGMGAWSCCHSGVNFDEGPESSLDQFLGRKVLHVHVMSFIEQDLIPKRDKGAYNHV